MASKYIFPMQVAAPRRLAIVVNCLKYKEKPKYSRLVLGACFAQAAPRRQRTLFRRRCSGDVEISPPV
jgi:hypothetical protein